MADQDLQNGDGVQRSPAARTVELAIALLTGFSLLAVFLLPSQSGASFSTYVLALIVLAAGSARWRTFGEARLLAGLLIALLLYFSSSVWWSADTSARGAFSIYTRCVLILTFVVALSTTLRRIPDFATWLARSIAAVGGVAALAALVEFHLHPTFDGRLVGLGQLRNSVIASLAFDAAFLWALHVAIADSMRWRVVAIACAALIGCAIVATGSRAGYLAAIVGIWVLFAAQRSGAPRRSLRWFVLAPLCAVVFAGVVWAVHPDILQVVFPRGDSFRLAIWRAEWDRLIARNPLFGLGILTNDRVTVDDHTFSHPHSLYLASALQGGAVGLLLLLGLLACAASMLLRNLHQSVARFGLAMLAAGMSAYFFDGWELIDKVGLSWLLLWVPVAVAIAVGETSSEGNTRNMVDLNSTGHSSGTGGREP